MDPNANLEELRELVRKLIKQIDNDPNPWEGLTGAIDADDIDRVLELAQALDGWIGRGGFLPDAWSGDGRNHQTFTASRSEFSWLLRDYEQLLAQVTDTQTSNTALLTENREMKHAIRELLAKSDGAPFGTPLLDPFQALRRFVS
jgi:ADP-heptose:LPS heptosyltransferase